MRALGALLVCGGGVFVLASGCGSDDGKKAVKAEEAGAAGQSDGGAPPSSGGSMSSPSGAPGAAGADAGQAGALGSADGGVGGVGAGGVGAAGEAGQGAGGAPLVNECTMDGTVTDLALLTEPIYQGCRGAVVHVPFDASDSTATFTCCGTSTSEPSYDALLQGLSNFDGGGDLLLPVPADAPLGSYAMNVACPTQVGGQAFALEINDLAAPIVTDATASMFPKDPLVITGENLDGVTAITAVKLDGSSIAFCNIDAASRTTTSVTCTFNAITPSQDAADLYELDIASEQCGSAANRPSLLVTPYT